MGKPVRKLPGGGLEFGEGPEETVLRELREELDLEGRITRNLHVTGDFIRSWIKPEEQLICIYYRCELEGIDSLPAGNFIREDQIEFSWLEMDKLKPEDLDLPSDQAMLRKWLGGELGEPFSGTL